MTYAVQVYAVQVRVHGMIHHSEGVL